MALYLGLDSSTQSLSAIVIEVGDGDEATSVPSPASVITELSLRFDEAFPGYGTRNGVLESEDPRVVHSSPLMWAEALDTLLGRLRDAGIDLSDVRAVAGSGQQHGSVYLNADATRILATLDAEQALVGQLDKLLSRATSPIWMDSSTQRECQELSEALGGPRSLADLTGSRAFERFTGPQIRKFYKDDPEGYARTDKIHLVSSFMASLLGGKHAPIDPGDGAGMNLMNIATKEWEPRALAATAPGLERKLPPIEGSWTIVGEISPFFARRHGFSPDARVVAWSGDNPCSLIGVGLVKTGRIAISLGTSDTLFGFMPELRVDPAGEGHVFGSPTGHYMSLICFKNGSLAREKVRDRYGLDWDGFNRHLAETPAGNNGRVLLPWFFPEITPNVLHPEVRCFGFDWSDACAAVRGVVEGQMAAMALHRRWTGVRTETIYATGGAAANRALLQVMADMFGAEVYPSRVRQSAALGAALRAWHADARSQGRDMDWEDIVRGATDPVVADRVAPVPEHVSLYRRFQEIYRACEDHAIHGGEDPTPALERFRRGE